MKVRNPRRWTKGEDDLLRRAVAKYEDANIDWHDVASYIEGRNNKDCRKRWIYSLEPSINKGSWDKEEDALLIQGVRLHGSRWASVSQVVGSRQPDQCARRWHESLKPNINHGRWSLLEDETLKQAVGVYGRKWTVIVEQYLPNRTPIAAKNRYTQRFLRGDTANSSRATTACQANEATTFPRGLITPTAGGFDANDDFSQQASHVAADAIALEGTQARTSMNIQYNMDLNGGHRMDTALADGWNGAQINTQFQYPQSIPTVSAGAHSSAPIHSFPPLASQRPDLNMDIAYREKATPTFEDGFDTPQSDPFVTADLDAELGMLAYFWGSS